MNYKRKGFCVSGASRETLIHVPTGTRALPLGPERTIITLIDSARYEAGMSQAELAEKVGVSQSQLSKLLLGERAMTLTEMTRCCDALGLKASAVFAQAGL